MTTLSPNSPFMRSLTEHAIRHGADPIKLAIRFASIPPLFRHTCFETLDAHRDTKAFELCRRYADLSDDQLNGKRGLLLTGPAGNGKTSLSLATLHRFVEQTGGQRPAVYWEVSAGLDEIRRRFGNPEAPDEGVIQLATENDLVILDDLGKQKMTPWVADQFYALINTLYTQQKRVIVTTNFPLEQLMDYLDYALISRLVGMCHEVQVKAPDYRLEAGQSSKPL